MNDFTWTQWIPGIAVLVGCLTVGLVVAFRQLREVASASGMQARDLELKIVDLETRRDELYERLRGEAAREVDPGELNALERAAACTLRDLDRAHAALEKLTGKKRPRSQEAVEKKVADAEPAAVEPRGFLAAHPLMVGFGFGAGMVALVAILVFTAQRDAQPGSRPAPSPGGQQAAVEGEMPADHPPLEEGATNPTTTNPTIAALEKHLQENPDDFRTRKQLALSYLNNQMLFPAYQEAQKILATAPQDPDGLFIAGVVRLAMGDMATAISLLDQVLEQFPNHVLALVYRGLAQQQLGDFDSAVESWEQGLAAAGGRHPELEQMIAQLKAAPHGPGAASQSPGAAPPAAASAPAPAPPASSGPRTYSVRVELPSGTEVAPGSVLFVSLHDGSGGPPAASKRLGEPSFPVEVTLDAGDSMMGVDLPPAAVIQVRLDRDGDPSTEGEEDLWARGEAQSGQLTKFVLW